MISSDIKSKIVNEELTLLEELNVSSRLETILSSQEGLKLFAEVFYFIRYDFCKLNFIVGSKCPPHEKYWSGLTENLLEELGGGKYPTHNQLYRDFLFEVGHEKESELTPPDFTEHFNNQWENYCTNKTYQEGLAAIGLYEALDIPDYKLLYKAVKNTGLSGHALLFFSVHAKAEHFEMFSDVLEEVEADNNALVNSSIRFVIETQRFMWSNLLLFLEKSLHKSSELEPSY